MDNNITEVTEKTKDKKIMPIIVVIVVVILAIASMSNTSTSESFDLAEQLSLGQKYLQELDYEQAILTFSKILEIEPMCVESYIGLAQAYIGLGDIDSAIAILEKGFEMTGDSEIAKMLEILKNPFELVTTDSIIYEGENLAIDFKGGNLDTQVAIISKNPEIATIDTETFAVLGVAIGTTEIEVTKDDVTISFSVVVEEGFKVLELEKTILAGDSFEIEYISVNDELEVRASSNSEEIATIDIENFAVLGVSAGTTDIVVTQGNKTETIKVNVEENPNYVIEWVDKAFESGIRKILNKPTEDIRFDDVKDITSLYIVGDQLFQTNNVYTQYEISSAAKGGAAYFINGTQYYSYGTVTRLDDIVHFASLNTLYVDWANISDISPIANSTNLVDISFKDNKISNISTLSSLSKLEKIDFFSNQITNISSLTHLTNLKEVDFWINNITDISPLSKLTKLQKLNLWSNKISDLSPISNLTNLVDLNLNYTETTNITALTNLTNLKYLQLSNNPGIDITPLSYLTNLTELTMYSSEITDITPLSNLTNLTYLSLMFNKITDWSPVAHLETVSGRP